MGIFAGGVENTGDSSMVDMFDFGERRVLPRMYAPTIRYSSMPSRFLCFTASTTGRKGRPMSTSIKDRQCIT